MVKTVLLCAVLGGCANVPVIAGHPLWGPSTPEQTARASRALAQGAANMREVHKSYACVNHQQEAYCQ